LHFILKKNTFVPALVSFIRPDEGIKRESGENPEQSRCCKLHINVPAKHSPLVLSENSGRLSGTEASQKTCRA